jgi:hypothetical protein
MSLASPNRRSAPAPGEGAPLAVTPDVLAAILAPYKPHCRYLQSAEVEVPSRETNGAGPPPLVRARGAFQIPQSWYINDTGHFNSIEFNICYNQLVYTLIGQCTLSELVPELRAMTFAEYLARQLPDVLIAKFSSAFKRPMDSQNFHGTVSLHGISSRRQLMLLKTSCWFEGDDGGYSDGNITLAIVNREREDQRGPGAAPGA